VYRDSGQACPRCAGASLRESNGYLVCDSCDSLLLREADLAASIHEIDATAGAIIAKPSGQGAAACPRCANLMSHCELFVGAHPLGGGFLRCAQDGVWMPRDVMVALYAWAGQRAGAQPPGRERPYGRVIESSLAGKGVHGAGPAPGTGMVAVLQSPREFARHGSDLIISQRPSGWPYAHTAFVSALRGRRLVCPVCSGQPLSFQVDRWACERCTGSFVEDAALIEMVSAMTNAPWELPVPADAAGSHKCPACAAMMTSERLAGVAVQRCPAHGVWFSAGELQTVLEHAGRAK